MCADTPVLERRAFMASERLQERDLGSFGPRGARVKREHVYTCKIDVKLALLERHYGWN